MWHKIILKLTFIIVDFLFYTSMRLFSQCSQLITFPVSILISNSNITASTFNLSSVFRHEFLDYLDPKVMESESFPLSFELEASGSSVNIQLLSNS